MTPPPLLTPPPSPPRHRAEAIEVTHAVSAYFMAHARRNLHRARDVVEEDELLIYNWSPLFTGKHRKPREIKYFDQAYVFPAYEEIQKQRQQQQAPEAEAAEASPETSPETAG